MNLYLCEKPSQAKDLAAVLGVSKKGNGYLFDEKGQTITWAYGHLLEMYMPDDYDERYKSWSLETLPISPETWKYKVRDSSAKQYKVIVELLNKASSVFIATDFDREGEAIARSLMERANYSGPVQRVCLRALDAASIRKALASVKDGKDTMPLYYSALARQRADWLIGMNISRIYTVLSRKAGYDQTLHIGRVITPTITLVCQRDTEIANFKPSPFWTLDVEVSVQNGQFNAAWVAPQQFADTEGRCTNKTYAEQVAAQVSGTAAVISKAETKAGKESAPLPFDLTSLQQYGSKRWGYTAQEILDAAQSLYETHKATTYPRTDCRYIPESQRADIPHVLQAIMISDQSVSGLVAGANSSTGTSSRAFNDKKVTAHHAIIPTQTPTSISAMSEIEFNLYDAIRRFYIAQFYSAFEFSRTNVEVSCGQHLFTASGKVPIKQGWKVLFNSDSESDPEDESDQNGSQPDQQLPHVNQGEPCQLKKPTILDKVTRPLPHFSEASLLAAMENIARFVTEEKFKKILKETAGLGTPATRAGIIQGAVDKGYLIRKKKTLLATSKAHALISVLPAAVKSPGMTAAWEQELEKISTGEGSITAFMRQISQWICTLTEQLKANSAAMTQDGGPLATAFAGAKAPTVDCFNCGGALKRIKGKTGFFWACRTPSCKKTYNDNRGKPVDPEKANTPPKNSPKCPDCSTQMLKRKGKDKDGKPRSFWGCSNYPVCKGTAPVKARKKSAYVSS